MCCMVNSAMVYQEEGGGIITPCLMSNNIAYFVHVNTLGKNTIPFSNNKFWSFSTDNQVFKQTQYDESFDPLPDIEQIIVKQLK